MIKMQIFSSAKHMGMLIINLILLEKRQLLYIKNFDTCQSVIGFKCYLCLQKLSNT